MADRLDLPLPNELGAVAPLNESWDLGDEEFSRLLEVYLMESERQYHEANEAWEAGDLARLGRSARGLGGASKVIGAVQLAGFCIELELAARRNWDDQVRVMLQQVTSELREVRDAVHVARQGYGSI